MKKIEAYIKSRLLDELILTLQEVDGFEGLTVIESRGFGRGGTDGTRNLKANVKIELVCSDDMCNRLVAEIEKAAHTGLRSDGKIYVLPVEQALRISTGEREV